MCLGFAYGGSATHWIGRHVGASVTLMETYVAAVFRTEDDAQAFETALSSSQGVHIKRAGLYARNDYGDLSLQGNETDTEDLLDILTVSAASQQEAIDELSEQLPAGAYAVLALVDESDPSILDELAREYRGTLYRRTAANLETSGFRRFTDATGLD